VVAGQPTALPRLPGPLPPRSRPRRSAGKESGRRTSNYRGVSFHKPSGKWRVRIKVGSQEVRLGYFSTELEAAHRYDDAARLYHGADAWLNFNSEGEQLDTGLSAARRPAGALDAATVAAPTHKAPHSQPASAAARAAQARARKAPAPLTVPQGAAPSAADTCPLPRQPSSGSMALTVSGAGGTPPRSPGSPTSVLPPGAQSKGVAAINAALACGTAGPASIFQSSMVLPVVGQSMPRQDGTKEAFMAASLLLGMQAPSV